MFFSPIILYSNSIQFYVVTIFYSLHRKHSFGLNSDLWSFVKVEAELAALQYLPPANIIIFMLDKPKASSREI